MKKKYTLWYYEGTDKQWYWRITASNKKVVADGSEGYSSKSNMLRALKRLKCFNFEFMLVREVIETGAESVINESFNL